MRMSILLIMLGLLGPLWADPPPQDASESVRYWFVYFQPQSRDGRDWFEKRAEPFSMDQITAANQFIETRGDRSVSRVFRFLNRLEEREDATWLSGQEMADEVLEAHDLELDPLLVDWLEDMGPGTVGVFLKLLTRKDRGAAYQDAEIIPYRQPSLLAGLTWGLGSMPPSLDLESDQIKPFAPYLIGSLGSYLASFCLWVAPCILLGFCLGLFEGYGLRWLGRGSRLAALIEDLGSIFRGVINAVPRLLLIILFVLLFRKFQRPVAFWMIALPLGISCIPPLMTRVRDHLQKAITADMIALRRTQGFSHGRVLLELWRYRLFAVPAREIFGQLIAFIYAETLVQFMIRMSTGAMQGIAPVDSPGYILVRVSYALSMSRHGNLPAAFEWYNFWTPLLLVLFVLSSLVMGSLILSNRIERGMQ